MQVINTLYGMWSAKLADELHQDNLWSMMSVISSKPTNHKQNLKYLISVSNQLATTARMCIIRSQSENAFIPLPLVRNDSNVWRG